MGSDNEQVIFAKEAAAAVVKRPGAADTWKVLIVDDEEEVHAVTRLVLKDFEFAGKGLTFLEAYSGEEAKKFIAAHPDTAVMFLDVVMERHCAGLEVVRYVREELKNSFVRIILRTGQPGQAPEEKVIVEYDINDYKEKTELTAQKLFTSMVASLRAYRDILTIEANRRGLEKIMEATRTICKTRSLERLASGVLAQMVALLRLDESAICCTTSGVALSSLRGNLRVLAATGAYERYLAADATEVLPQPILSFVERAATSKQSLYEGNRYVEYFCSDNGDEAVVYLEGDHALSDLDRRLIRIFCANVQVAYENVILNQEIEGTQKEIIYTLGELAEVRSSETGNHVKRVSEYCRLLAELAGLDEREVEVIRLASPMHDIGKVAIPDAILNKPGPLTGEEFEVMKAHTVHAQQMLGLSDREIMKAATIIALQHHEKYNGTGYPRGLKGEEIHLYARITAVADVFDALCNDRSYRHAWNMDDIVALFHKERGAHFDPKLVDLFLGHFGLFVEIKNAFANHSGNLVTA